MDFGSMFSTWQNVLLKPKESLTSEAAKDSTLMDGFMSFLVGAIVVAILVFLGQLVFGLGALAGIGAAIIDFIGVLVLSFLGTLVIWILAMILGGKASYTKLYYLSSTFTVPLQMLMVLLSFIPLIGGIISILLWLYSLVLLAMALKRLYGFDNVKAGIVVAIPVIVLIIALVVLGAAFLAMFTAVGGSSVASGL